MAGNAAERSNLYGFLATIFRHEPSLEFLRDIRKGTLFDALFDAGVTLGPDVLERFQ